MATAQLHERVQNMELPVSLAQQQAFNPEANPVTQSALTLNSLTEEMGMGYFQEEDKPGHRDEVSLVCLL